MWSEESTARSTVLAAWKDAAIGVKEMWKQRCEITVAWEEEHGIRQAAKEGKGNERKLKNAQPSRVNGNGRSGQDQARKQPSSHQPGKRPKQRRKSIRNPSYSTCPLCHAPTGDQAHEPWEHTPAYLARHCAASIWAADRLGIYKIPPGYTTLAKTYIASYDLQRASSEKHFNPETPHDRKQQSHNIKGQRPPTVSTSPRKEKVNNKRNQPRNIYVQENTNNTISYHLIGARQQQRQIQKQQPRQDKNTTSTHTPHQGVHAGRSFFVNNFFSSDLSPLG
jgi:hypothetical protein